MKDVNRPIQRFMVLPWPFPREGGNTLLWLGTGTLPPWTLPFFGTAAARKTTERQQGTSLDILSMVEGQMAWHNDRRF